MIKRTLFFSKKCSLSTKHNQLVVKSDAIKTKTIPIEDIGFVVLENQQTYISIPALTKLSNNNVAVIFCDEKHLPQSMLLNLESHPIQQELFKHQINASEPLKKQLWQQNKEFLETNYLSLRPAGFAGFIPNQVGHKL